MQVKHSAECRLKTTTKNDKKQQRYTLENRLIFGLKDGILCAIIPPPPPPRIVCIFIAARVHQCIDSGDCVPSRFQRGGKEVAVYIRGKLL